jgi:hypothetical protein
MGAEMTNPKTLAIVLWIAMGVIVLVFLAFFVGLARRADMTTPKKLAIAVGVIALVLLVRVAKHDHVWGILAFNALFFTLAHVIFQMKSWWRTAVGAVLASIAYIALGGM